MSRSKKFILAIAAMVVLAFVVGKLGLVSYVTVDNIRDFNESHGFLGPILFILIYTAVIVLMLPVIPFAVLAGAVFGLFPGFVYISIGAIIGASVAFYIARHYGRGFVDKISRGRFKSMDKYEKKVEKNGFRTVLLIRLIPLLPFKSPNYLLGFTKIKQKDYTLATIIGIVPESFVFAYVGASFSTLSLWRIFEAVLVVGGLCTIGYLVGQRLMRKEEK